MRPKVHPGQRATNVLDPEKVCLEVREVGGALVVVFNAVNGGRMLISQVD